MGTREEVIEKVNRIVKIILGLTLIAVGAAGIFLPIIPGVLFMIIGVLLISNKNVKKTISNIIKKIRKSF